MSKNILTEVLSTLLTRPVSSDTAATSLQDARLAALARMLHYRIARSRRAAQSERCSVLLEELTESAAARLLRAPVLCEHLRRGTSDERLLDLLDSASIESQGRLADRWTPLGDCWMGRQPPLKLAGIKAQGGRFWTPSLANGCPLDYSLDLFPEIPSSGLRAPVQPPGLRIPSQLAQIDDALELVAEVFPIGAEIFSRLVSNIVLREDRARPAECWGATSGIAIGRVVLVNAASARDRYELGEILLHEAVHCALDCAELVTPMMRAAPLRLNEANTFLTSPWTSNPLSMHAFVHACVVWATLLHYWRAVETHYGASEFSGQRRRHLEQGFARLDERTYRPQLEEGLAPVALTVINLTRKWGR